MRRIPVRIKDRSYRVLVGAGLLAQAGRHLRSEGLDARDVLVVSQEPVSGHHSRVFIESLGQEGYRPELFVVPASRSSEAAKSWGVFQKIIRRLASLDGAGKSPAVAALGGGVIGDVAGFAASVYRRGIPFVQVPTTLTAQVDSSIGGKTAIDLPEGKNLLGSIAQPAAVLADTALLDTLPGRRWSDGFAEVIKYGVILDGRLFEFLERQTLDRFRSDAAALERIIASCVSIKAGVVEKDEFDKKGVRILLNFGHTAGHAIETVSGYGSGYTHGEAVAIGMLVACEIARSRGILREAGLIERLEKTLVRYGLPLQYKRLDPSAIFKAMGYDKKNLQGKNRFVLPVRAGRMAVVRDVPREAVLAALERRRG